MKGDDTWRSVTGRKMGESLKRSCTKLPVQPAVGCLCHLTNSGLISLLFAFSFTLRTNMLEVEVNLCQNIAVVALIGFLFESRVLASWQMVNIVSHDIFFRIVQIRKYDLREGLKKKKAKRQRYRTTISNCFRE